MYAHTHVWVCKRSCTRMHIGNCMCTCSHMGHMDFHMLLHTHAQGHMWINTHSVTVTHMYLCMNMCAWIRFLHVLPPVCTLLHIYTGLLADVCAYAWATSSLVPPQKGLVCSCRWWKRCIPRWSLTSSWSFVCYLCAVINPVFLSGRNLKLYRITVHRMI